MRKHNHSQGCCNSRDNHFNALPAVQADICVIPEDFVTISRGEYADLVRASIENDIMRRMISEEDSCYLEVEKCRIILGLPKKVESDE